VVAHALAPAALVRHPPAAVIARREISAAAEAHDLGEQRILHAELAAVFDEGRHAVANELGHGESSVELERCRRSRIAVFEITRIALDDLAFLRNGHLEKRLPVIHGPAGVGDQPMRCAVAGMHVGVDQTRRDQLSPRAGDPSDAALAYLAGVNRPAALHGELCLAPEPGPAARSAQQPPKVAVARALGIGNTEPGQFGLEFRQGMRDLGYIEGQNIRYEFRSAHGQLDRLPELAAELVRLKVDVIVTWFTPTAQA